MTVFDPGTLHDLADDAAGRVFVLELAATYRRMLEHRVGRIVDAVVASDYDDAMDAVLSLKVSSTMTGARELAELAAFLEADLRTGNLPSARSQALLLPAAAHRAGCAIDAYLTPGSIPA